MSNAIELDDNTFEKEILNSEGVKIVDFWAPWCGPCRKMGPILDEVAEELKDKVKVYKINTDENTKVATDYMISSIPCLYIFQNGEAKETLVGLMPKSHIISNVQKYL